MGNVTVTIRTVDDQAIPVEIDGVLVRVFDSGGVFLTEGTTGSVTAGEVDFTLNGDAPGIAYSVLLSKDGVSFPPAPTFAISVTDPPNPDNLFSFTGHVGITDQLVTLACTDSDTNPIEDVRIRVFDIVDTFLTELDTDVDGEADLVLPGAADPGTGYIVRLYKAGFTFDGGNTQAISVHDPLVAPNTNIFDFTAPIVSIPQSLNPDLCKISGYLTDVATRPLDNVTIRCMPIESVPDAILCGFQAPNDPVIVQRNTLMREAVFQSSTGGYIELELPREGSYHLHIYGLETPGVQIYGSVYVPDAAGATLEDVIFPFVTTVTYNPTDVVVAVDENVNVVATVLGSNLKELDPSLFNEFLEFTSSDEAVMTLGFVDGELVVTGVSSGTAEIVVARAESSWAGPRRPAIPDLVVTNPVVTVT